MDGEMSTVVTGANVSRETWVSSRRRLVLGRHRARAPSTKPAERGEDNDEDRRGRGHGHDAPGDVDLPDLERQRGGHRLVARADGEQHQEQEAGDTERGAKRPLGPMFEQVLARDLAAIDARVDE